MVAPSLLITIKGGIGLLSSTRATSQTKAPSDSYKYGFILRYPEGKEKITGYMYEEWHFRYLGEDLANKVYNSGLTYDEYVARQ